MGENLYQEQIIPSNASRIDLHQCKFMRLLIIENLQQSFKHI